MSSLASSPSFELYKKINRFTIFAGSFSAGFTVAVLTTNSVIIGIPFGVITIVIPKVVLKRREERARLILQELWPEILDHIISGLQSGLSLADTLVALSIRGPMKSRSIFKVFSESLRNGSDFSSSIAELKNQFKDGTADQVCEVLDFARSAGSRDTSLTLRTLSNFIRNDLALRAEISAKHSWVRNSAALAAVAPWILLLLLASQPNTVSAYASGSGFLVLIFGAILTIIAYIWMERVGKIREIPRIFI
ncbi:MAG: type II secretion system F family protein [SAR202 cluster bacterium]|jgi:tight adherence protein B|nr:type II secretion system F family protein [SAR202 cluster bacterium]